jgi:response regulator RpfG family c-di-GMP phosphodiesterase
LDIISGYNILARYFTDEPKTKVLIIHDDLNACGGSVPAYYDLVISDLRMPKMNGFEFIKIVKKIKPEVKVFLMTAFEINHTEFSRLLPDVKIDKLIEKPISIKELSTIIDKIK